MTTERMEVMMNFILTVGTCFSLLLVLAGGTLYLIHHGNHLFSTEFVPTNIPTQLSQYITNPFAILTPLNLIGLGLIILVATQLLKVFLLMLYYMINKDVVFSGISGFVLLILLVSLVWRP